MATSTTGSVTKRMLISVDRDEARAAVVEDNQLVHLEIEPANRNTCKGNIYRAVVARVEPSLQSAFVDFGNDKQGFLPVGEIHPKLRGGNNDKRAPIQDLLKARTEIMVQVVRDEIGQKGATLSTFISLPGRYLVLIPESDNEKAGVSRKLSDEARDRVKKLTETMKVPEGFGLIVRTAGDTATELELVKDLTYLTRQWEHIVAKNDEGKGPQLLYAERSLPVRFVRDYFTKDIEEVVIDDDATLHEVGEFLQVLMPRGLAAVVRYAGDMPLFARYGVEGKVEDVFARQVFLPSGGSIVIDQTEAMVAIDVNSGRMKEKDIEETARATNIEAAQEIARQMILRDMGGLIVIDFIDMREKKYVREVEMAIKDAFKNDKARTKLGHISEFGLLEMSRQRIKSSVNKGTFDSCPHCSGIGRIRSMESVGASVLRRIYDTVAKKDTATQKRVRAVMAMVPPAAARYLLNSRRHELYVLEKQYHLTIEIVPVDGLCASQIVLEHLEELPVETSDERADRQRLLRVTQELDLVRNQLIKREEARVTLEMAAARRSAKVDYAEIYAKVREATGPAEAAEKAKADSSRLVAESARKPVAEEAETWLQEPPAPKSFWSEIKSFFGLSEPPPSPPAPRPTPARSAQAVAAAPTESPRPPREYREPRAPHAQLDGAAPQPDGRDGPREDRGDRDRDGRRRRRGRGDRPEGQRPEGQRPEGQRPEGQRAEGQRSEGSRSEGQRSHMVSPETPAHTDVREDEAVLTSAPDSSPFLAAADTAAGTAEGLAAREGGQRRRRRRRRSGGRDAAGDQLPQSEDGTQGDEADDGLEASGDDVGAEEVAVASGEEGTEPVLTETDVETPAGGPADLAEEAPVEAVAEPAEEAVDVSAAIAEEVARLREAAGTTAPEAEPAPVAPVEPPAAKNRFVVDLRSGR